MPLVVLCGRPSSGKSTVAKELVKAIGTSADTYTEVILVDEPSLRLSRDAYRSSALEKTSRGQLKTAAERALARGAVVVLDSLNYIKGFRYELHCAARAQATRYAVVHVDTDPQVCAAWNRARRDAETEDAGVAYSDEVMADLLPRFERPDGRNRWDDPLFEVRPDRDDSSHVAEVIVAAARAVLGIAGPSGPPKGADLRPTCATSNPALSDTNLLHQLDSVCQNVIGSIQAQQAAAAVPGPTRVSVAPGATLHLPRSVSMAELRRHKLTFLKLVTQNPSARLSTADTALPLFLDYLQKNVT